MVNNAIGYIICEADIAAQVCNLSKDTINGKAVGEAIVQTADEKNRNGRYYAKEELFPQLTSPRILELLHAGYLRAEMGHPLSKDLQRQSTIDDTKTCARFLELWTQGNDIWAKFTATNSKYGQAFDMDLKEGCLPAWSLRALGSIQQTRRGAEVRNLRVITWDNVIYPSHPGAYTQRILSEETIMNEATIIDDREKNDTLGEAFVIPFTNTDIISFIQAQSQNLKFVRECFDFAYNDITVNESGTKVQLTTNNGDILIVNLEAYIHNELMEYADRIQKLGE